MSLRKKWYRFRKAVDLITSSKIQVEDIKRQDIIDALEDKTIYHTIDLNDLINYN